MNIRKSGGGKKGENFIIGMGIVGVGVVSVFAFFILSELNDNISSFEILNDSLVFVSAEEKREHEKKKIAQRKKRETEKKKKEEERKKKEEIQKAKEEEENKVNILIVGRGGVGNDAPQLTDSIILLSYHKKDNYITMLSIPRDLYVEYGDRTIAGKINGLYVHYLAKNGKPKEAIKKLQEKISSITNEKIDYSINLDFRGFTALVDSLGGIYVEVPKTLIDNRYPGKNHSYQTFILKKGKWLLNGVTALKYVRSRKNTGGDFGRSERQQQIVKALKDRLISGGYMVNPVKIKKIYDIFTSNVTTDIEIVTVIDLFAKIKMQDDTKVYSSGLNATCIKRKECEKGGYLYYPQRVYFNGQSVLLNEMSTHTKLDVFTDIQEYANIVFNAPEIFEEQYDISIFSVKEDSKQAKILQMELKQIGLKLNILDRIGNIENTVEEINQSFSIKKERNDPVNLFEYNKNKSHVQDHSITDTATNTGTLQETAISQEFRNMSTKLIINGISKDSKTVQYLKKKLHLTEENIEIHQGGPKYARNKMTKIEILYKHTTKW